MNHNHEAVISGSNGRAVRCYVVISGCIGENIVVILQRMHYGTKPGHFETSKIHFPTSEGVSEVSE